MVPLFVLVISFLIFRFAARRDTSTALRWALALMFLVTASAHWGARRADLIAMVPPVFPRPDLLVTLTGIAEIAGAIGLLSRRTAPYAAIGLALLMLAMFPANVYAAQQQLAIGGKPVTPLLPRMLMQLVFVAAAAFIARGAIPSAARRDTSLSSHRTRPTVRA